MVYNPAFQRFAVRTSRRIEDISNKAVQKRQELAEQMKDISKNFEYDQLSSSSRHFLPNYRYQTKDITLSHSPTATVESDKPEPKISSNADHEGGKKSGDSNQSKSDSGKPVRGGPVSWLSFLLLISMVSFLFFILYIFASRKINNASQAVKQGPSVGKAAIGGPFNLINHDGKNVTDKDFVGNWTLVYFGFTHCPDICPDELQKLAAAVDKIKEKAGTEIIPVFISVDPERDTVEQVREYVKEFHTKLIGLTGKPDEIKNVARGYRVYYMKTAEEDPDYLVDHSIVMYLMSPKMEFVKFFGKNNDVDSLTDGIIKEIKQLITIRMAWKVSS
ncbi:hypothetical protein JRO89_XS12G0068100 [Xanthoceras sorbifolium]|uniref:Thioredoxin domain-containing protein n=1 Tax=Xanthoceras sorbifolium TaxID=99658 RepID=A0ABQ8HBK7_9ROSI|nr:hypothetical protein JRO89_XS12G0068100 [Xanthoceras sorbifolium]